MAHPEAFFTRIKIVTTKELELTWIYSKESLFRLGLKQDGYEKAHFLKIGNSIRLFDKDYKIININFKVEIEFYKMGGGYGLNMSSPDEPVDYNSTVNVIVEELEEN